MKNIFSKTISEPFPHWATLLLCLLFAILYGVWILPHTVFIRHTCMTLGGILGIWSICRYSSLIWQRRALPIALIFLLLLWVTIHLFWFGKDFDAQIIEYLKIWKKIALSVPFAIGLGLAIASNFSNSRDDRRHWQILYMGFCLPTLIYFVKFFYAKFANAYDFPIPNHLLLIPYETDSINEFGVARAWYVFFCLPAFAIALGKIIQLIESASFHFINSWPYLIIMMLTVTLFYIEGDRFGMIYITVLLMIFSGIIVRRFSRNLGWKNWIVLIGTICIALILVGGSISKNPQWRSLLADSKVAVQVDRYDHWKNRAKGYPVNEYGQIPTDSNYSRLAWAIVGSRLLLEQPLGYGLMSTSFSPLGKEKWPDSDLSWTHSAWLDFGLGYGIPGLLLLGLAVLLAAINARHTKAPWRILGLWGLFSMALVMTTKEVSAEAVINSLIFLVVLVVALSLKINFVKSAR